MKAHLIYKIFTHSIDKVKSFISKTSQRSLFLQKCDTLEANIDDLILVTDINNNIKFIKKTCQVFFNSTELNYFKIFINRNYTDYFKQIFDDAINKNDWTYPYVEFPIKGKNGRYIWIRLNITITKIHNELLIIGTMKDINIQSNHFYHTNQSNIWFNIFKNSSNGIWVEDSNRRILFLNDGLLAFFDMNDETPSTFIGEDCNVFIDRLKDSFIYPNLFSEGIEQNILQRKNIKCEVLKTKNGKTFERDYTMILNPNGEYSHFWYYRDVTQNYNLNEKVKESEEKYTKIIENMQLGILEVDNNDTITNVYNHFCQITGYTKEELIGKKANEIFLKPENKQIFTINQIKREQGISSTYEVPLVKKDGTTAWLLVSGTPIFNHNNEVIGSIGIHYDITERKQLEQDLKHANDIANKATEREKMFLASMTHELKTPINAILGMGDLLKLTQLNIEQKDYLDVMETSTMFLQKLISDILDISKIETGNLVVNNQSFDLKKMLSEITRSFEYSLSKKNITFKFEWKFKLDTYVIGDPLLLQQIIINLLSNAEKFTEVGTVKLVVERVHQTNQHIKLRFTVEDTGIGLSKENEDNIFEKFVQLPATKQHKSQGTGLGLSIVKSLVEIQNSSINVSSSVGKGSIFSFDLVYEKGLEIPGILKKIEKPNRFLNAPLDELRVLIVEDNILNQEYLKRLFRKWAIYCEIAGSGEEAIKKFSNTHFDCVMVDIQLPGINGFELSIKLRTTFQNRVFFIIAMTAVVFPKIEVEILKYGMDDIIKKPFTTDELYDKISICFDTVRQNKIPEPSIHFHSELDTDFLTQFYKDDIDYAIEVFVQFHTVYLKEFESLIKNSNNISIEDIKKRLHTIKPSFKMVGLTKVELMIEEVIKNNKIESNALSDIFLKKDIKIISSLIESQIWDLKRAKELENQVI